MTAPINSYFEAYGPRFFLEMDGITAEDIMPDVISFDFVDHEKKMDQLTLVVNNRNLHYQDDFRFVRGARVKVRWGYANDMSDTRQMLVTEINHSCPEKGVPVITLRAFDIRRNLNKKGNPRNWGAVTSSSIATRIAKRYRLQTNIANSNDARKEARLQPADTTDMQYLLSLATKLHWDMYVEGSTLHFHPKRYKESAFFEFVYFTDNKGTLLSFVSSLNLKKYPKTGKAGANGRDGSTTTDSADGGSTDEEHAADHWIDVDAETGALFGSPQSGQPGLAAGNTTEGEPLLSPSSETDPSLIKRHAKARQAKIEAYAVKSTAKMIGTPKLRSRHMVSVQGVGQTYSGNWRIEETRHHIVGQGSSIYVTSCKLKRNAVKKGSKDTKLDANSVNDKDPSGIRDNGASLITIDASMGAIQNFSS